MLRGLIMASSIIACFIIGRLWGEWAARNDEFWIGFWMNLICGIPIIAVDVYFIVKW